MCASNNRASNRGSRNWYNWNEKWRNPVIIGDFNTPPLIIDRKADRKLKGYKITKKKSHLPTETAWYL